MKNQNGISLIKICIIVAIIFIVATICAFIFEESEEKKEINKFVSQMELVQEKVNWTRSKYKVWENYAPNETGNFYAYLQELEFSNANNTTNPYIDEFNKIITELENRNVRYWNSNIDTIIANYCYFSPEDLKNSFGIENIDFDIIINFYTGNVISKKGVIEDGEIIYRQYDSNSGNKLVTSQIYNTEFEPKLEIVENYGLSQKVKISLDKRANADIMDIYYYSSSTDDSKKLCSKLNGYNYNKEENAVYFYIENSGEYTFIVEDANFVQYPQIEYQFKLCNPPEMLDGMMGIYWGENGNETRIVSEYDSNWYNYSENNLRMANAKTEDGNYWVWIPRYAYKETIESIEIEFLKEKTNISANNKVLQGYKVCEVFSENEENSGFWISKFQGNVEENKIHFKPGKTLSVANLLDVQNKYINLLDINLRKYSNVMSEKELTATLNISKSAELEISNNLVHYTGGSPVEDGFKENVKYSSSNNVYGVYDLVTSANEITRNSEPNEEGRFRLILIKK